MPPVFMMVGAVSHNDVLAMHISHKVSFSSRHLIIDLIKCDQTVIRIFNGQREDLFLIFNLVITNYVNDIISSKHLRICLPDRVDRSFIFQLTFTKFSLCDEPKRIRWKRIMLRKCLVKFHVVKVKQTWNLVRVAQSVALLLIRNILTFRALA